MQRRLPELGISVQINLANREMAKIQDKGFLPLLRQQQGFSTEVHAKYFQACFFYYKH